MTLRLWRCEVVVMRDRDGVVPCGYFEYLDPSEHAPHCPRRHGLMADYGLFEFAEIT